MLATLFGNKMVKIIFLDNENEGEEEEKEKHKEKKEIIIDLVSEKYKHLNFNSIEFETTIFHIYNLPGIGNFLLGFGMLGKNERRRFFHLKLDAKQNFELREIFEEIIGQDLTYIYPNSINSSNTSNGGLFITRNFKKPISTFSVVKLDGEGKVVERNSFSLPCRSNEYDVCREYFSREHFSREHFHVHICLYARNCVCECKLAHTNNVVTLVKNNKTEHEWKFVGCDEKLDLIDYPFYENSKLYSRSVDNFFSEIVLQIHTGSSELAELELPELETNKLNILERKVLMLERKVQLPDLCKKYPQYAVHTVSKDCAVLCFESWMSIRNDENADKNADKDANKSKKYIFVLVDFFTETSRILHEENRSYYLKHSNFPRSMVINTSIYDFHFSRKVS
jgi:hypothetical protein